MDSSNRKTAENTENTQEKTTVYKAHSANMSLSIAQYCTHNTAVCNIYK